MTDLNPQVQLLERAVDLLEELAVDIVFIGGATISLFLDDPAAEDARLTDDVDCVVSAATYAEFAQVEKLLRQHGFTQLDVKSGPMCRWKKEGQLFDIVPSNPSAIGFTESKWLEQGLTAAEERNLPSGRRIAVFDAPHMLAAKIEAYRDRGGGNYMMSKDFEDIVTILNGRTKVFEELREDRPVCIFVRSWFATLEESRLRRMFNSHLRESGRVQVLKHRILDLIDSDD